MSLMLIVSILIRLTAMCWSIVLLRQIRDWRMGFLSIMLGFMLMRQVFTLLDTHESWSILITWQVTEFPGLIVSIMAFLSIFFLNRILIGHKKTDEELRESSKSISLMKNIASVANESNNIDEAIKTCMDMICSYTGWPIGHYYATVNDELCSTDIWYLEHPEKFEAFRKVSEKTRFAPGVGLPGRILSSGEPAWIVDVSKDSNFPRAMLAKDIGVKAGFGFPIKVGKEVTGVLEFFSEKSIKPNLDELEIMAQVGTQLGRVAERKQAAETLRESNERFRASFADAAVGMALVSGDHSITEANQAYCSMLGYSKEELVGVLFKDITHPDDVAISLDHHQKLIAGEIDNYHFEKRYLHKQGHEIWALLSVSLVRDKDNIPVYSLAQIQDISERKKAEAALIKSESKYRGLMETAPDGMVTVDSKGEIEIINQQLQNLTGYKSDELIGKPVGILIPERFDTHEQKMGDYFSNPRARMMGEGLELFVRRKDGSEFSAEISLGPLETADGLTVLATIRDITERKQAEVVMKAKNKAEAATEAKNSFLANMSHEVRTPMNAVLGMSQILMDSKLSKEQHDYAKAIHTSGNALLDIINDILDFSKIEAGKLDIEPVPVDLTMVVSGVVELLRIKCEEKDVQLNMQYATDTPQFLIVDPGRLRQILLNFVDNAVKFTEQGHVLLEIDCLQQNEEQAELRFTVTDTGIGIAEDAKASLFDSFSQADPSTTRKYGGTGLGLAISKKLVEQMGGKLSFESTLGEGSRFWFTLNLLRAAESDIEPPSSADFESQQALEIRGGDNILRVLLVEDDLFNQKVGRVFLEKSGCQVDVVANGQEAVQMQGQFPYDIVFMDCQMPVMDGFQATAAIRESERDSDRHQLIIAMTANAIKGDYEMCLEKGMDDYLSKPVSIDRLQAMISKWCD